MAVSPGKRLLIAAILCSIGATELLRRNEIMR